MIIPRNFEARVYTSASPMDIFQKKVCSIHQSEKTIAQLTSEHLAYRLFETSVPIS